MVKSPILASSCTEDKAFNSLSDSVYCSMDNIQAKIKDRKKQKNLRGHLTWILYAKDMRNNTPHIHAGRHAHT